jgi:hypothetical protein
MKDEGVYTLASSPKYHPDDEVLVTFNLEVEDKEKYKLFAKHHLEWEPEECIRQDKNGKCLEVAGSLTGSYKNAMAFLKAVHGNDLKNADSYITKI